MQENYPEPYKYIMKCMKCPGQYWYRSYPPYKSCYNCGSEVVMVQKL